MSALPSPTTGEKVVRHDGTDEDDPHPRPAPLQGSSLPCEGFRDSIREYGVLSPLLARPKGEGYELVSGHRRRAAAQKLGMTELPVLVREMIDDEAIILMVDSNIQRENLLPSEKAFAYKMKLDAIKRKAGRLSKQNLCQVGTEYLGVRSDQIIANELNESARTIQRYIRLTHLIKPILNLMDEGRIALSPGVEMSYLTQDEQAELWDIIQAKENTPSYSQAVRMKKLSQAGELSPKMIMEIMKEDKPNQKRCIKIDESRIRKYFPKNYSAEQIEDAIIQVIAHYHQQKRKRDMER